jgi:hypothetical protein
MGDNMREKLTPKVWMAMGAAMIVVATAGPARADERIAAMVPFDFIVGDSRLPAGDYVITEMSMPGIVSIESADAQHSAIVLTIPSSSDDAVLQPEIVFERFGSQHFLARITGGGVEGREIPLTPAIVERGLRDVAIAQNR